MTLEYIPKEIITDKILGKLDHCSLGALNQINSFFNTITDNTITKRKSEYISDKLSNDSNNLSLEKIEDYVDFLAKESSVRNGASSLIKAIKNTKEILYGIRGGRGDDPFLVGISDDPESERKQYQFQMDRLEYLKEFYYKKFGLFGLIYNLICKIDVDQDKSKYSIALEVLHLIKLAFSKEHHPEVLKLLNDYNTEIADYFRQNPDQHNDYLFLGKAEPLIFINITTKAIQICGKPIDDMISSISQQELPEEIYNNDRREYIDWMRFKYMDDESNITYPDRNEAKKAPEFQELVETKRLEAESNAKLIMDTINTYSHQNENSLKM